MDARSYGGRRSPPAINTSNTGAMPRGRGEDNRRFSYAETPLDMQSDQSFGRVPGQRYQHNQEHIPEAETPIEAGVDGYHMQTRSPVAHPYAAQAAAITGSGQVDSMPRTGQQPARPHRISSPYGVSESQSTQPAYQAPPTAHTKPSNPAQQYTAVPNSGSFNTETQVQHQTPPQPQTQYASYPQSQERRTSSIPMHSEADARQRQPESPMKKSPIQPDHVQVPYSPHSVTRSPTQPIFAPAATFGPNGVAPEMHQPGQVAHPNMLNVEGSTGDKGAWEHSLCGCGSDVDTCLLGLFCPCILDSKTAYRMGRRSEKKDPTDMLGFGNCNGRCSVFMCGLCCIFPLTLRTRIRHAYKLQGSFAHDVLESCCCCCCVAIQNEREVRDREGRLRQNAGPAGQYRSDTMQMIYTPGAT